MPTAVRTRDHRNGFSGHLVDENDGGFRIGRSDRPLDNDGGRGSVGIVAHQLVEHLLGHPAFAVVEIAVDMIPREILELG